MAATSLAAVLGALWLATLPQAATYGQLTGVVRDPGGGVLPGVSVTLSGRAAMGSRSVLTESDGSYRFRPLEPGRYELRFQLDGFRTLVRQGLVVAIGTTIRVDAALDLSTFEETLTVRGESPMVDVKSTRVGGTFSEPMLQQVPSATDLWAVLAQSPGIRMRGYDVGGSHKSQQTSYEAFGVRGGNRVLSDGVDSTEGTEGAGLYYDYYALEEVQVSAGGADVEMTSMGASVVMAVKSGSNELSGLVVLDFEDESFVGDNLTDELAARGFTGNPNLLFWELHGDVGGPIVRDRVWFFGAYNHFTIDKAISGRDPQLATDRGIFDNYTAKLSVALTEADKLVGYSQWGRKEKPAGGSLLVPRESASDQLLWSWVHKLEWQRLWSSRLFTNVQMKHFGSSSAFEPVTDPDLSPPRIDTATGLRRGGAGFRGVFRRFKPHASAQVDYYVPDAAGRHDLKIGLEWQLDSQELENTSSPVHYFDNSDFARPHGVDEIRLANHPTRADSQDLHLDVYIQDIWTPSDRLSLSAGVRLGYQRVYYRDNEIVPALQDIFTPARVEGATLLTWLDPAPRLGLSYDLTGSGKTAVKAHYGRYFWNLAGVPTTPVVDQNRHYEFADPNENGVYDGPHELGELVSGFGGADALPVNLDLKPWRADEISFSLEHELFEDAALRLSYVRKNVRNPIGKWNRAQEVPLRESGVRCGDTVFPCPLHPFTGAPLAVARVPDAYAGAQDVVVDNFPDSDGHYDTVQAAFTRRFGGRFFVQGSFDYQWRNELRKARDESQSVFVADPIRVNAEPDVGFFWQNHGLDVSYRQRTTNWGARLVGRYELPRDVGLSVNVRHQSGWPWAPIHRARIPGSGTQPLFLSNLRENRSDHVTLIDLRVDKAFQIRRHRLTIGADVYNLANQSSEVNLVLRTGSTFRNVLAALDPRTLKVGIRWQF